MTSEERIAKALDFALCYGGIDGDSHKTWVIDQMVRALTGCPMVNYVGTDSSGRKYECDVQGAGDEYITWVRNACNGEDGPATYSWDEGIPP